MGSATGRQEEISYQQNVSLASSDIHQQLNVTDPDHRDYADDIVVIHGSCERKL